MGIFSDLKDMDAEKKPTPPPSVKKISTPKQAEIPSLPVSGPNPVSTPLPEQVAHVKEKVSNIENNITMNITSNITILQSDIVRLREPAYKPQTFRIGDAALDKLKDLSHMLSRTLKKKVTQGDLLRIALMLLEKNMATNKADLFAILKAIK